MRKYNFILIVCALSACHRVPKLDEHCWSGLQVNKKLYHKDLIIVFSTMGDGYVVNTVCKHRFISVRYSNNFKDMSSLNLTTIKGGVLEVANVEIDGTIEKSPMGEGYAITLDRIWSGKLRPDLNLENFL